MSQGIVLPNNDLAGALAKQQELEALGQALFLAAFTGCVAGDLSRAAMHEIARRQAESVPESEPFKVSFDPDFAAKAAAMYARAGFQVLTGQKK